MVITNLTHLNGFCRMLHGCMSRIDGIKEKIKRAKEHVRDLEERLVLFRNDYPYEVSSHIDPKGAERVFSFKQRHEIPIEIPLRTGEILQNLRTALDYLVCALVVKNGGTETSVTGYPIFENSAKYKTGCGPKIKGMSKTAMNSIDLTKPYRGGTDALWHLHKLNNREKHRLLLTTGMVLFRAVHTEKRSGMIVRGVGGRRGGGRIMMSWPIVDVDVTPPNRVFPVEDGTEFFSAKADVNVNVEFTFEVAFNEPKVLEGEPILPTVHQLTNLVEGIVSNFSAFL